MEKVEICEIVEIVETDSGDYERGEQRHSGVPLWVNTEISHSRNEG
jgi:hypothetical protein